MLYIETILNYFYRWSELEKYNFTWVGLRFSCSGYWIRLSSLWIKWQAAWHPRLNLEIFPFAFFFSCKKIHCLIKCKRLDKSNLYHLYHLGSGELDHSVHRERQTLDLQAIKFVLWVLKKTFHFLNHYPSVESCSLYSWDLHYHI